MDIHLLLIAFLSYLIGSIPTAYWIGLTLGKDITKEGSGNVGATNALRVLGKKWGGITLAVDILKGFFPVFAAMHVLFLHGPLDPSVAAMVAAGFAILGHSFSFWIRFKGGKGVATGAGTVLALAPLSVLVVLLVFVLLVATTRLVSLGSVTGAALLSPLYALLYRENFSWPIFVFLLAVSLFIIYKHRQNIKRLLSGTESRISFKQ